MNIIKTNQESHPFRIKNNQGCHSPHSPVIGTSANDLKRIYEKIQTEPVLRQFENALYYKENSPSLIYLIPVNQKEEADRISQKIFLDYIGKYATQNAEISEETIVHWHWNTSSAGECRIREEGDLKNWLGWHVEAKVRPKDSSSFIRDQAYLPPYLVAYHEVQHVEDILPFLEKNKWAQFIENGTELKESLKTLILCDQVFKEINQLGLYSEVKYGKFVLLNEKELPMRGCS